MAPVVGSGSTPACTAFVPNFIESCLRQMYRIVCSSFSLQTTNYEPR
jgi:hypothetical protein